MNRVKYKSIEWAKRNLDLLKTLSYTLNVISALIIILWVFKTKIPNISEVDFEAILALTSLLALLLNHINSELLEDTEYSPADALAYGYVHNFLLPVITQLKSNGVAKPKICIYKTGNMGELDKERIDLVKADLQNKNYTLVEVKLDLKQARARDILTIQKGSSQTYFDFPSTLLSLVSYIDFKLHTKANTSAQAEKIKLTTELMVQFYQEVDELLKKNNISKYITYCDIGMKIF